MCIVGRRSPFVVLKEMDGLKSAVDILRKAVEMEEEAIGFYAGLKGVPAEQKDQQAVAAIIAEECRHRDALRERSADVGGEA